MKLRERYDTVFAGAVSALLLPGLIGLIIYLFTSEGASMGEYLAKIGEAKIITHAITLCVFPNIGIFLLFNSQDMFRAMRGVLAMTIIWAIIVFIIKFSL